MLKWLYKRLEGKYGARSVSEQKEEVLEHKTDQKPADDLERRFTNLDKMEHILKKRDPTAYQAELELIKILRKLMSDHNQHYRLNAEMWARTSPEEYRDTVRELSMILGGSGVLKGILNQIDRRTEKKEEIEEEHEEPPKQKTREDELAQLKKGVEEEYRIRERYKGLLKLMLEKESVFYDDVAGRLNITKGRARGLISEFENSAFRFERKKVGRRTALLLPESRKGAVKDVLDQFPGQPDSKFY